MLQHLEGVRRSEREDILRFLDSVVRANEPTILPEGTFAELTEINERTFVDFDGIEKPLLSDEELRYLMINKGNLDQRERREIESHVSHTFRFLEQIPWTRWREADSLKSRTGTTKTQWPRLPATGPGATRFRCRPRMMTISDIYDALTATDRLYKLAVPADRAIEIFEGEAIADGALDGDLLDAFVEGRVYELVSAEPARGRSGVNTPL